MSFYPELRAFRTALLASIALLVAMAGMAQALTVSGRVAEADTAPMGGVTITVEQVGGEFVPLTTMTAADGTWSVSDPLLFGNIKVTPSAAGTTFSPASRETFTDSNLPNQNFTATVSAARPDLSVLDGSDNPILTGGTFTYPQREFPGTFTGIFMFRNDGTAPLTGLSASITGPHAAEFAVITQVATTLAPGAFIFPQVSFTPAAAGLRTATLLISSNDPNENPYVVNLSASTFSFTVANTNDSGPGSLRQAMADTVLINGDVTITFDQALSGQTITLGTALTFTKIGRVTVNASGLPGGITLRRGPAPGRIMDVATTGVTLEGLTFVDGRGEGVGNASFGGAVSSEVSLALRRCTFQGNSAPTSGGAVASRLRSPFALAMTVEDCTFSGNSAVNSGGAIYAEGALSITGSTFTGNRSSNAGGAVRTFNTSNQQTLITRCTFTENLSSVGGAIATDQLTVLSHCTVSKNTASLGGGVTHFASSITGTSSSLTLHHSIIAGNQADTDTEVRGVFTDNFSLIGGTPLLAPLGDYGGPTQTMALLPGSPARNAATASTATSDQRGFPIIGVPDIGAYEAGTLAPNYNAYIWETLPTAGNGTPTDPQHAATFDFDNDGQTNNTEFLYQTNAANGSSFFTLTPTTNATGLDIAFPSSNGRSYRLQQSDGLDIWIDAPGQPLKAGNGATQSFIVPGDTPSGLFFRVQAETL